MLQKQFSFCLSLLKLYFSIFSIFHYKLSDISGITFSIFQSLKFSFDSLLLPLLSVYYNFCYINRIQHTADYSAVFSLLIGTRLWSSFPRTHLSSNDYQFRKLLIHFIPTGRLLKLVPKMFVSVQHSPICLSEITTFQHQINMLSLLNVCH